MADDVQLCSLYLGDALGARLPATLCAMTVSPLLRELATRVSHPFDCSVDHDPLAQTPLTLPLPR
ncbi:AraC family transcriptional regulator, partial [Burkholderia cenocepacia]|nr:AraC family transcriptional regulator [Burkholderia cenocepacia]